MSNWKNHESTCCESFSKATLVVFNIAFLCIAAIMIYFSVELTRSAWIEIFAESYPWIEKATFYVVLAFGVVFALVAIAGCVGALREQRCLLKLYMGFLVLALVFFTVMTVAAFGSNQMAQSWSASDYPAASQEETLANSFNDAYCYSQGVYYCTEGDPIEAFALFYPDEITIEDDLKATLQTQDGILQACEFYLDVVPQIKPACDVCLDVRKYEKFSSIYEWTQEECPLTTQDTPVITYCLAALNSGRVGADEFAGTPYELCRPQVLDFVERWSLRIAILTICVIVACAILVVFVFYILRKPTRDYDERTTADTTGNAYDATSASAAYYQEPYDDYDQQQNYDQNPYSSDQLSYEQSHYNSAKRSNRHRSEKKSSSRHPKKYYL